MRSVPAPWAAPMVKGPPPIAEALLPSQPASLIYGSHRPKERWMAGQRGLIATVSRTSGLP